MLQYSMREHEEVLVSEGWISLGAQEWKDLNSVELLKAFSLLTLCIGS